MHAAFDELSTGLKNAIEGRLGAFAYCGRSQDNKLLNAEDRSKPPALHPLVRSHPETGRLGLYSDPGKILRVEGLDERDSNDLLDELT